MSITLIAVGKMKEKPYRQMADEYLKRLSRYGKVEEIELPDLPEPQNSSPAIEAQIKEKEGDAILARIKPSDYVIAMTIPTATNIITNIATTMSIAMSTTTATAATAAATAKSKPPISPVRRQQKPPTRSVPFAAL